MAAGDHDYVFGWVYDSDDDVPIAAGDSIYRDGPIIGDFFAGTMRLNYNYEQYWLANNANPAGIKFKGYEISTISYTHFCIDGVGFYCALGKATADTPAADQFTIQGSTDGDVPARIFHTEDNTLSNEQAREFAKAKTVEAEVLVSHNALCLKQSILAEREYNMTTDSVVRQTGYSPTGYRGDKSGAISPVSDAIYRIGGNTSVSLTWNSKTLSNFIISLSSSWKNPLQALQLSDGNDYPAMFTGARREYSPITIMLQVDPAATNDLDDLQNLVDGSTSSDLVLKVPRRHANDYLQLTWKDVYLVSYKPSPSPSGANVPSIEAVFTPPEDLEVVDRQVDSAGSADANADATYEL